MGKAPLKESLSLHGPAGKLEALVEQPAELYGNSVAVLCHPHPQHQGTMHNKVVHTLARAMNDLSMPALRFNFRGIGASEGQYGEGIGEIDDVIAVAEYARERWPESELWLAGFSFGAVVSVRAALQLSPARLISIAPAVNMLGRELSTTPRNPWLIVQGEADEVVPAGEVRDWVATLSPRPELVLLPEVDHFFHGKLVLLRELLVAKLGGSVSTEK
jgi:alpha/beta superfamily hydrolase